jgi:hypothetical protein
VVWRASVAKGKIMNNTKRLAGLLPGVALLACLILGGSALAQEPQGVTLQLTPSRDSGVSGTVTLADVEGGVQMRGLPEAGVEHINHIHEGGTCAKDRTGNTAPATIPLKTIVAQEDGTGSATTTLEGVTVDKILDPDKVRYVALHSEVQEEPVPPVISCADVVRPSDNGVAMDELPESGGTLPVVLLSTGAIMAILGATAGILALRRYTG